LDLLTPEDENTTYLRNRLSYDAASYSGGTELSIVNNYYSFEVYISRVVHVNFGTFQIPI